MGAGKSLNGREKNSGEEKLGTKKQKFCGTNQKPEQPRPFGTGALRPCPQGLFSSFLTFLRPNFFLARLDFFLPPLTAPGSPRMVIAQLRLISFKMSHYAKAKLLGQSLDDMLVYAKDYGSSADDQILNSFKTHPQSPRLNNSK